MTIVVAGHLCVDLTPHLAGTEPGMAPGVLYDVGPLSVRLGGSVANTGGELARLGVDVRAFAAVGRDELADVCRTRLAQVIDDVRLVTTDLATSYSIVVEHPSHDRSFWHHPGACAAFDPAQVELGDDVAALHLGYPSLLPGLCADAGPVRRLFARARDRGVTTSLDLAHVAAGSAAAGVDWANWFAGTGPHVDVWTPSWDDLSSALGGHDEPTPRRLVAMADRMLAWGAGVVSLSAGSLGFVLKAAPRERLAHGGSLLAPLADTWGGVTRWFDAERIDDPTTTVGAGDALTGAILDALRRGLDPDAAGHHARDAVGRHLRGR